MVESSECPATVRRRSRRFATRQRDRRTRTAPADRSRRHFRAADARVVRIGSRPPALPASAANGATLRREARQLFFAGHLPVVVVARGAAESVAGIPRRESVIHQSRFPGSFGFNTLRQDQGDWARAATFG